MQSTACVACLTACGTWGKSGSWDACDCPGECYPEGVIADKAVADLTLRAADPTTPFFYAVGFKRPHLSYRAPKSFFDMYNLDDIELPVHPRPSDTAPGIAYSHSCQLNSNSSSGRQTKGTCDQQNFTHADGSWSAIEVQTNPTAVKSLRLAYYAVTSFTDSQLGRVLDHLHSTGQCPAHRSFLLHSTVRVSAPPIAPSSWNGLRWTGGTVEPHPHALTSGRY